MRPATFVINRFGGVRACAKAIGRTPGAVSMWQRPRKSGGGKGQIPVTAQKAILKASKKLKLGIKAEDLIFGRRR